MFDFNNQVRHQVSFASLLTNNMSIVKSFISQSKVIIVRYKKCIVMLSEQKLLMRFREQ